MSADCKAGIARIRLLMPIAHIAPKPNAILNICRIKRRKLMRIPDEVNVMLFGTTVIDATK